MICRPAKPGQECKRCKKDHPSQPYSSCTVKLLGDHTFVNYGACGNCAWSQQSHKCSCFRTEGFPTSLAKHEPSRPEKYPPHLGQAGAAAATRLSPWVLSFLCGYLYLASTIPAPKGFCVARGTARLKPSSRTGWYGDDMES